MNTVRWNPWREFDHFFNQFARLPSDAPRSANWLPAVEVSETENAYQIAIEIPAVDKDAVKVEVKDGVLAVSGERKQIFENGENQHRSEFTYGRFTRSFRLPDDADEETIDATAKDGVLYLTINKHAIPEPKQIEVKVH